MKRQDIQKLHRQTEKELRDKLSSLQKSLVETRMQLKMGKEANLKKSHLIRKDIARVKTVLRNQELLAPTQK